MRHNVSCFAVIVSSVMTVMASRLTDELRRSDHPDAAYLYSLAEYSVRRSIWGWQVAMDGHTTQVHPDLIR